MLRWPHSGFSVDDSVWLDQDDRPAHERLARYCARNPVSLDRLEYDPEAGEDGGVTYTSDKARGPTAGHHTFEPLELVARLVNHIPDKGQVLQRYYGYYASRTRYQRRMATQAGGTNGSGGALDDDVTVAEAKDDSRRQMRLRWAALLRRIFEVDPLVCPAYGGQLRMIAFILQPRVIDRILRHVREKGKDARAGPWSTPPGQAAPTATAP